VVSIVVARLCSATTVFGPESVFLGARMIAANVAQWFMFALFAWFAALFVLFLLRVLLRKEWAAAIAWAVLFTVLASTAECSRRRLLSKLGIRNSSLMKGLDVIGVCGVSDFRHSGKLGFRILLTP
jgi:hypothetical protein